jgi:hypothetical protein
MRASPYSAVLAHQLLLEKGNGWNSSGLGV